MQKHININTITYVLELTPTLRNGNRRDLNKNAYRNVYPQNLLAGQGVLNDNNWHTIRFSRRASNLRLQVDGAAPVRGTLCMYQQHL